jgi:hypothetical protein
MFCHEASHTTHNNEHFKICVLCIPLCFIQLPVGSTEHSKKVLTIQKKMTTPMAGIKQGTPVQNDLQNVTYLPSSVNTRSYYCLSLLTTRTDFKFRNTQNKYYKHDVHVRSANPTGQQKRVYYAGKKLIQFSFI